MASRRGGSGFVRCDCGHRHWGRYGAAGLLLTDSARGRVLLQLRSAEVLTPHTWALPGGALERGEDVVAAALREAEEEAGLDLAAITALGTHPGLVHPQWSYTYVLAETQVTDLPPHRSREVDRHAWVPLDEMAGMGGLHRHLARDWPSLARAVADL